MTNKTQEIVGILLDGKHVKFPLDFSVEEGWVLFEIPRFPKNQNSVQSGQSFNIEESEEQEVQWETKKQFGKVEFLYS